MDKVLCPYCGAEMIPQRESTGMTRGIDFMQCSKCAARSPEIRTLNGVWDGKQDAALAAATQRWQEPNRVLTLDEVVAWGNAEARPVYTELNAPNGQARMVELEAAKRDIKNMLQSESCEEFCAFCKRSMDDDCSISNCNAEWRGPCAENGGLDDGQAR